MTKEEMTARLEAIKDRRFRLAMIDRWDAEIYKLDNELFIEQKKLIQELREKK